MSQILICVACVSLLASIAEYLLPEGGVREVAQNAIGFAEILCIAEILIRCLSIE